MDGAWPKRAILSSSTARLKCEVPGGREAAQGGAAAERQRAKGNSRNESNACMGSYRCVSVRAGDSVARLVCCGGVSRAGVDPLRAGCCCARVVWSSCVGEPSRRHRLLPPQAHRCRGNRWRERRAQCRGPSQPKRDGAQRRKLRRAPRRRGGGASTRVWRSCCRKSAQRGRESTRPERLWEEGSWLVRSSVYVSGKGRLLLRQRAAALDWLREGGGGLR